MLLIAYFCLYISVCASDYIVIERSSHLGSTCSPRRVKLPASDPTPASPAIEVATLNTGRTNDELFVWKQSTLICVFQIAIVGPISIAMMVTLFLGH